MVELSFEQILTLTGLAQIPTWTVLAFVLKKLITTCERLAKEETKSEIYHPINNLSKTAV